MALVWELWVPLLLLSAEVREDTGFGGTQGHVGVPQGGGLSPQLLWTPCAVMVPCAMGTVASSSGLGAHQGFGGAAGF